MSVRRATRRANLRHPAQTITEISEVCAYNRRVVYRSQSLGFEVTLPAGWKEPGFIRRLFTSYDRANPELNGPGGKSLKFTIRPVRVVPTVAARHAIFRQVAGKLCYDVIKLEAIEVGGRSHATMVYDCLHPELDQLLVLRFKSYALVFPGVEYEITARVAILPRGVSFTRPQAPDFERKRKQRKEHFQYAEKLQQIFAYEEDYDAIVGTFRRMG